MDFVLRTLDAIGRGAVRLWHTLVRGRVVLMVAVVLIGALGVSILATSDEDDVDRDDRPGSLLVEDDPADPLAPRTRPTEYRIVYAVAGTEETVTVRRPFSGHVAGPGGTKVSVLGRLGVIDEQGNARTLNIPPGAAVGDVRVFTGSYQRRERRRITGLDRQCDVYRTEEALPVVEMCVDANGMVLERLEFRGESVAERRLATALDLNPALPAGSFDLPDADPLPVDEGGGATVPLAEDDETPLVTHELRRAPRGFARRGRFSVVPPRDDAFVDILAPRRSAVVDVWEDGIDFIALEQGQTAGRGQVLDAVATSGEVDLGNLGDASVFETDATIQVLITSDEGRYVRVYGTVSSQRLVEVARSLRPVP